MSATPAILTFLVFLSVPACLAAPQPGTLQPASASGAFEERVRGSDIAPSLRALGGPRVILLQAPARYAAGVAVPAGVANLYKGNPSNDVNHHQNGHEGEGEDEGKKKGHHHGDLEDGDDGSGTKVPLDNELILNNEFTHGLSHWDHHSAYVTDSFGPIRASELSTDGVFAVAHTGYWGPPYWDSNDHGFLEQAVNVPMSRNAAFNMLYNFVTGEYPVWVGTQYNDQILVTLSGPSGELMVNLREYLNSASFTPVSGLPMFGWPLDAQGNVIGWHEGGQTGWKIFNQGSLALKSGIYRIRIEVRDAGDDIVDSAILVDRVSLR